MKNHFFQIPSALFLSFALSAPHASAQDGAANALIVEAMGHWNAAKGTSDAAARLEALREVQAILDEIVEEHASSSHAVTFMIGEAVGPLSIAAVEAGIKGACEEAPKLCGADGAPSMSAKLDRAFALLEGLPGGYLLYPLKALGQAHAVRGEMERIDEIAALSIRDARGQLRPIDGRLEGMLRAGAARGAALVGNMDAAREQARLAAEAFGDGPYDYDMDGLLRGEWRVLRNAMLWAGFDSDAPPLLAKPSGAAVADPEILSRIEQALAAEPFDANSLSYTMQDAAGLPPELQRTVIARLLDAAEKDRSALALQRSLEGVVNATPGTAALPDAAVSRIDGLVEQLRNDPRRAQIAYMAEGAAILMRVAAGDQTGALARYDAWNGEQPIRPVVIAEALVAVDPVAAADWLQRIPDPRMRSHHASTFILAALGAPDEGAAVWDALYPLIKDPAQKERLEKVVATIELGKGNIAPAMQLALDSEHNNPGRAFGLYGQIAEAALRSDQAETAALVSKGMSQLLPRLVNDPGKQAFYALPIMIRLAAALPGEAKQWQDAAAEAVRMIERQGKASQLRTALAEAATVEALASR